MAGSDSKALKKTQPSSSRDQAAAKDRDRERRIHELEAQVAKLMRNRGPQGRMMAGGEDEKK